MATDDYCNTEECELRPSSSQYQKMHPEEYCTCESAKVKELYEEFYGNLEDHAGGAKNVGQWGKLPIFKGPRIWVPPWLDFREKRLPNSKHEVSTEPSCPISQPTGLEGDDSRKDFVELCKCGDTCYLSDLKIPVDDEPDSFEDLRIEADPSFTQKVPPDIQGPYIVCCTGLSGGIDNLECGLDVGTIFSIYKRDPKLSSFAPRTANMSYKYLVSSGYALYTSSTKLILSIGKKLCSFILDPVVEEFVLNHDSIIIPEKGQQISVDEGHSGLWEPQILEYMKRKKDPKTTLLCECIPLAHIVDLAGGAASTGKADVLKTEADQLGQYIPFFIGSKHEVQELLLITSSPARG